MNGFSSARARKTRALTNRAGRYVNRAGRKGIRAGRKILRAGRGALRNRPSWNTGPVKDLVSAGFYSLLFLIHKDADEFRPVIDLFCLNRFLDIPTFRMKTAERITACFRPNFCITALDLEKAYFDFPVQPDYWKYLLFQTEELFQVCARPLGIYPALWLLAIQHGVGRSQEDRTLLVIQLFLYPDDWLIQASTEDLCAQDTDGVVQLGLLSNHMKSALVANQECVFLMYVFRLTTLLGFLPQKRREPY